MAFEGNYYWVPGAGGTVKLLQYAERLRMYQHESAWRSTRCRRRASRTRRFSPEGQPLPRHLPRAAGKVAVGGEATAALGASVVAYLDYVLPTPGIQCHRLLGAVDPQSAGAPGGCSRGPRTQRRYRVVAAVDPPADRLALP